MPNFRMLISLLLLSVANAHAANPLFSGPQVGEKLAPFEVKAGLGDNVGKTFNAMEDVKDDPVLIAFIHELTRPNIALTRLVMQYANERKLKAKLVFLTNDQTETEKWMQRAKRALPNSVTPLMSTDGIEGPGVYGLNRNVKLTIVMGKDQKVTHNFATGQPSIQADGPKLGKAIAELLGDKEAPTLAQMGFRPPQRMRAALKTSLEQDGIYREMMTPLIRGQSDEQVEAAAKAILEYAKKHPWMTDRVGKASSLIVNGGKVENYGTAKAQSYLKQWAKEFDERQEQAKMKRRPDDAVRKKEDTPKKDTTETKND